MKVAFKTLLPLTLAIAGALFSGCATGGNNLTFAPVGPSPAPSAIKNPAVGTLTVYSAFKRNADFNIRDNSRPEYSDYQVLAADGTLLHKVHNNTGTIFQDAVSLELAPGKYSVVARANAYGYLTIPVIIEAQHNTALHLEGGNAWPDESEFNQTNSVRLPDGQVIGWRADSN